MVGPMKRQLNARVGDNAKRSQRAVDAEIV